MIDVIVRFEGDPNNEAAVERAEFIVQSALDAAAVDYMDVTS